MKKALHAILKFLLVVAIFLGLQGRVLVRYAEMFHKNHKTELVHSSGTIVKAGIVHCKLQCYTQHFRMLDIPFIAFFLITLIAISSIIDLVYIHLKDKLSFADPVRFLPLRAPPVF
jgi:hypothetical protein